MPMWKYNAAVSTGRNYVERFDNISMTNGGTYNICVPLTAPVGSLSGGILAGDVFVIISELQVSTPYTYNVYFGGALRVNDSTAPNVGTEVGEANGQNFNNIEHHFTLRKSGIWVADQDYDNRYINLNVWAASSAALSGHKLTVDQDYGFIHVLQLRS